VIRINLLPRAEARRRAARRRDRRIALGIPGLLAAIILASEWATRASLDRAERAVSEHETELVEVERRNLEARELERKRVELDAKLATTERLERQRTGPVRLLEDVRASIPEKLWLTEMRESAGGLSLAGRGLDDQTIAVFLEALEASPFLSRVDLVETKQVEEGEAMLKEFSIRAAVAYAAPEAERGARTASPGGAMAEARR